MATAAYGVVGRGIGLKLLVRVVARGAGEALVAGAPALAGDEAVGRGAHGGDTFDAGELDVPPGAVTGAAEVDRIGGSEMRGVKDGWSRRSGCVVRRGVRCLDVLCARAMARLAGDAGDEMGLVEAAVDGRGGGVTTKAADDLGPIDGASHGFLDACGREQGARGCEGDIVQACKVGDAGLVEVAVGLLEKIGLAHATRSEGPE